MKIVFIKKSKKISKTQMNIFSMLYFSIIILYLIPMGSSSNEITIKISGTGDNL